jgi:hypothetical protein
MGDLFDEFLRELDRRRAQAEGRAPRDDDSPSGDDPGRDEGADDDGRDRADEEPTPIRPRERRHGDGAGGGGPRRPSGSGGGGMTPPTRRTVVRQVALAAGVTAIVMFLVLAGTIIDLWTDAIWYGTVGFDSVFWTRIAAQAGLFLAALLAALLFLLGNLWLAGRLVPPPDPSKPGRLKEMAARWVESQRESQRTAERNARMSGGFPGGFPGAGSRPIEVGFDPDDIPDLVPIGKWLIAAAAVVVALGVAGTVSGTWETLLLWANRVPFSTTASVTDPVFGLDIGFFLFDLPFLRFAQATANGILLAALAVAGARYFLQTSRGGEVFTTRVRVHLAILAGLYLLTVAVGYQLDKWELVYSTQGVAVGVSYTDANARFLAYDVLMVLSTLAAALLVGGAFTRWMWPLGAVLIIWFSASIVLGRVYPEAIQRLTVDPNTYAQEEPYIANNIAMTQLAFGLDEWISRDYGGTAPLTEEAVRSEADTFTNARLWDYRPLQTTLDQLQTVRQYYDFHDVDTDRYIVDDELRQVMLSGREMAIERNQQATGWVNQRIIYTHGIGVAMVPVNEVTQEGQPNLWIKDLPPLSVEGAPAITQPRIYFGERDDRYVVVRARQAEFDYPRTQGTTTVDEETRWTGTTGVPLDTLLSRVLFAARFKDLDLLISDQITSESQLLFHRTIHERLDRIAPFLRYDKDPYLVIDEQGRLVYVQDAYTISSDFPNANWFSGWDLGEGSGLAGETFNYIRNSVKITMDAYDGTMRFYVADPSDPLIRAWSGVFPGLFVPIDELPEGLVAHLRMPEEQFNVQTRMFGTYHVTQPLTFFNNTDLWTVPEAQTNEQSLPSEAYYVVMRMPEEPTAEFLLLQPMIAKARPNMIAWVAARNDQPNFGQVVAYRFPTDTTIFGPAQIEARIDQDPVISAQISLWNQSGSQVIRGNLIVVPVGDSLLYLQPVYLQSTSAAFPEFQKIVVASPTTIVWGDSLAESLTKLLALQGEGGTPGPTPTPGPGATPGPTPAPTVRPTQPPSGLPDDVDGLIAYANEHFELAQQALRDGDLARYEAELDLVGAALSRLTELSASPGASATP